MYWHTSNQSKVYRRLSYLLVWLKMTSVTHWSCWEKEQGNAATFVSLSHFPGGVCHSRISQRKSNKRKKNLAKHRSNVLVMEAKVDDGSNGGALTWINVSRAPRGCSLVCYHYTYQACLLTVILSHSAWLLQQPTVGRNEIVSLPGWELQSTLWPQSLLLLSFDTNLGKARLLLLPCLIRE